MTRFAALEELRRRPIGDLAGARAARKDFRARVAIRRDNALYGEALVEAREQGLAGENFYAGDRNPLPIGIVSKAPPTNCCCGARWRTSCSK